MHTVAHAAYWASVLYTWSVSRFPNQQVVPKGASWIRGSQGAVLLHARRHASASSHLEWQVGVLPLLDWYTREGGNVHYHSCPKPFPPLVYMYNRWQDFAHHIRGYLKRMLYKCNVILIQPISSLWSMHGTMTACGPSLLRYCFTIANC